MRIDEIKERLSQERRFGSRFPVRIIFVERLEEYLTLENHLKGLCDVTLNIADFCRAPDTIPQFERIKAKLGEYVGKQVLLLSVGEYLRLCVTLELNPQRCQFKSFWEMQQSEAATMRLIIPMFSCREIFDRVVGRIDERQLDYVWTIDTPPSKDSYSVEVYSPGFHNLISPSAGNLNSWLHNWATLLGKDTPCSIITMQYRNVEMSLGVVNIKRFDSPFYYIKNVLADGNLLEEEWEDDAFWNSVLPSVYKIPSKVAFSQIVCDALNVNSFDFVSLFARWGTLNGFQKELVWLWFRLYPVDNNYYSYACRKANSSAEIPARIRDEILLATTRSTEWLEQRMAAMKGFGFQSFDEAYFSSLDKIPLPETRLRLLTYKTHEELAYAVKVISALLRDGAQLATVAELIANDYPSLAAYMRERTGYDDKVDEYMAWYKTNKLMNRYPGECPTDVSFESFDSRYKLLHKLQGKDCVHFWIDGFGVEYVPLFIYELKQQGLTPDEFNIATSLLPTETEYNHQWDKDDPMTLKWNRLDECSHNGMPDDKSYYSCIVHQLTVFADAAKKVKDLLKNHDYVVITGDHGSSRLAALAFHETSVVPLTAPNKAKVYSFGRFCEIDEKDADMFALPETTKVTAIIGGKHFLVMNTYRHFSTGGNVAGGNSDENDVAGETHGGNTVEERLVPVIVVKGKFTSQPLACMLKNKTVRKRGGRIEVVLPFTRPISTLEVSAGNNKAACSRNSDETWKVIMTDVNSDEIVLTIVADGKLLPAVNLKVKTQGIEIKDFFGGNSR